MRLSIRAAHGLAARFIVALTIALLAIGPAARGLPAPARVHADGCGPEGPASYLHTCGTGIVDANGIPVRLRAVNWYGFDSNDFVAGGLHYYSYKTIIDRIKRLGFNGLRIPLSNELVERNPIVSALPAVCVGTSCLPAPGTTATPITGGYLLQAISDTVSNNSDLYGLDALSILKRVIDYAGGQGLYVILDNHRSEAGWNPEENGLWYTATSCPAGATPYSCYTPQSWLDDWGRLGALFANDPAVVGMDLRNEPHAAHAPSTCADYIASAHWGPCGNNLPNNNPDTDWPAWAAQAGNLLLAINPRWLMFVEGVSTYQQSDGGFPSDGWGQNLQGVATDPVTFTVPGGSDHLVYSPHNYWFFDNNQDAATLRGIWQRTFGYLIASPAHAYTAPLWVGEYGACTYANNCVVDRQGGGRYAGYWFTTFQNYLDNGDPSNGVPGQISWSYWPVNGTNSDGYVYGGGAHWERCAGQRETYGYLGADWSTLSSTLLYSTTFGLPVQGTPPPPTQWPSYGPCAPYTVSAAPTIPANPPTTSTPVPPTSTPVPPTTTATNTPVPTATATNTPVPTNTPTATTTNTPVPTNTPTATTTNTPVPTNTSTPIPPTATATRTLIPPTATRIPVRPTPAPTRRATSTPAPARTVAPPLVVTAPRGVTSGDTLRVRVRTAPRAGVVVTLQVVVKTVTVIKQRRHTPVTRTVTTVPYRVVRQGTADKKGDYATAIRVTYKPARSIAANLIAVARTARGSATRSATVTIFPPRPTQTGPSSGGGGSAHLQRAGPSRVFAARRKEGQP